MNLKLRSCIILCSLVSVPSIADTLDVDAWITNAARPGLSKKISTSGWSAFKKIAMLSASKSAKPSNIYLTPGNDIQATGFVVSPVPTTVTVDSYIAANCTSSALNVDKEISVQIADSSQVTMTTKLVTTGKVAGELKLPNGFGGSASLEKSVDITNQSEQKISKTRTMVDKIVKIVPPNTILSIDISSKEYPTFYDFKGNVIVDATILGFNFKDLVSNNQIYVEGKVRGGTGQSITQIYRESSCAQSQFLASNPAKILYARPTASQLKSSSGVSNKQTLELVKLRDQGLDYRSKSQDTIEIEQVLETALKITPADIIGKIKFDATNNSEKLCTTKIIANEIVVASFSLMPNENLGWKDLMSFIGSNPISIKTESDCESDMVYALKYPI